MVPQCQLIACPRGLGTGWYLLSSGDGHKRCLIDIGDNLRSLQADAAAVLVGVPVSEELP